jgi:hypothetical protein
MTSSGRTSNPENDNGQVLPQAAWRLQTAATGRLIRNQAQAKKSSPPD